MTADAGSIPLPQVGGFSVDLLLRSPSPAPTPSASPSPAKGRGAAKRPAAAPTPSAAPSPSPAPSPSAVPGSSGKPSPGPTGAKIDTKTTIYPDDAPQGPTPQPTGNVQTFVQRTAIVRGYLMPHVDVTLPSLAAVQFTIPSSEQETGRGWTVALYTAGKHRKTKLIAADPEAALTDGVVSASGGGDPIKLKKDTGYVALLYGDAVPATPAPYQTYPAAGPIPGQTPYPGVTPPFPGAPGIPTFPPTNGPYPQPTLTVYPR